ncbi:snoRNA-binding rRNA-processing protein imp4 [Mitosporidium daphniae]|uniref:U3 small nucleolar ribonucleoprotein protein IMP4 n=1 Tax=Mitosporidium daphniae TaxID=1485682 RepID=A0A098VRQ0_9MICR|nr:uncharacterized protein DI09_33p60 [Mitosporidium daphniae]KGG51489.1 hypothetical protein DI09_33p60 [Mitosporidium daphniae]|eukprot:XP_013237939.1 uncharacterized protein DI09_33p60 [Mitosporidium daphniae]
MIRREARLRREYLYRKSLEERERQLYEKRQAVKQALDEGKPIPRELREEATELGKSVIFDPSYSMPVNHVDDEYANATLVDPKIVITTSRDPSSRLLQFTKEMKLLFPNSQRINRGAMVIPQLVESCKSSGVTDLICIHEHRGIPDGLIVSHFPHGPTVYFSLFNVVLRHDIPECSGTTVSEAAPHLIFEKFTTSLGNRVVSVLKHLFPIPKSDSRRVMTFVNNSDFISFRHHNYKKEGSKVALSEIGPIFEMRLYEIKLGTVDISEADTEWVLRPYQNTSHKRDVL